MRKFGVVLSHLVQGARFLEQLIVSLHEYVFLVYVWQDLEVRSVPPFVHRLSHSQVFLADYRPNSGRSISHYVCLYRGPLIRLVKIELVLFFFFPILLLILHFNVSSLVLCGGLWTVED